MSENRPKRDFSCVVCGKTFQASQRVKPGHPKCPKFCSKGCFSAGRNRRVATPIYNGDVVHIPLTHGQIAKVDRADYESIDELRYLWIASWSETSESFYAERQIGYGENRVLLRMHTTIVSPPAGMLVDHVSFDTLDNRRENLRVCTRSENAFHSRKKKDGQYTSKYKGVSLWQGGGEPSWRARIHKDGISYLIGYFKSEVEAALAWNQAALAHYGEFAVLNIIDPKDQ